MRKTFRILKNNIEIKNTLRISDNNIIIKNTHKK